MTAGLPQGYTVAPIAPDEIAVAAQVIIACDIDVSGYSEFSPDDMRSLSRRARVDLSKDSWLIRHGEEAVATALLWDSQPDRVFHSVGVVRKAHQGLGLGTHIIESIQERARERSGGRGILRTYIDMHEPQAIRLAEDLGFRFVRRHWSMLIDLAAAPEVKIPDGIRIRTGEAQDAPLAHELITETFAEHWNFVPMTYDEFANAMLIRDDHDPTLWFFAYDGGDPVGVVVGQKAGEFGWIADLGVKKQWRKRGIGEALLLTAFARFHERGYERVGLGVDTGNETGAVRLYEKVGMRPERGDDEYEKDLGAP